MPVYEEKRTINGQKRYFVRTYVIDEIGNTKQITKHNKSWVGKKGKDLALNEELRLKGTTHVNTNSLKFESLLELFQKDIVNKVKESTYISYQENVKNQLMPFFSNKIVNHENVLAWHQHMEQTNLSINYMNKVNTVLSLILDVAIKYRLLDRNYVKDIGGFKTQYAKLNVIEEKIKYIDLEKFNLFISQADDLMWYTVFYLLYFTGMRKGELIALTWKDIDFTNSQIKVNKTYTDRTSEGKYKMTPTKNYLTRVIDIDHSTMQVLKKWYEHEKDYAYLDNFVFGREHPISTTTMTNKKNKYFKLANFEEPFITIHEFRHSHVSLLVNEYLKSGNNDMTKFFIMMSNRMGHTIQVMQETYMHLFPDTQKPITNLLDLLSKQDQKQDQSKQKSPYLKA